MLVVTLLVVVLAVIAVAGLIIWIRRAASCGRRIDEPAGEPLATYLGGVMCKRLITSGSLARLDFFDWGVRVRGTFLSRWIVPTWEARFEELASAELASMRWSRIAVWFRLREDPSAMGFLSMMSKEILNDLERRGVSVNRAVAQISRVDDLYS